MKNFELLPETFGDANPGFASATSDSADNSTTCDTAANSGYSRIKQLKKDLRQQGVKVNIPDLLALSQSNDPFYAGSPGNTQQALWFVEQLNKVGLNVPRVHLRRVHYRLVSQDPPPKLWSGKTYANDAKSWQALNCASKAARYLRLVDVENFDDRRNPDPVICMTSAQTPEPAWCIETSAMSWNQFDLPTINVELANELDWQIPEPEVSGYGYAQSDQPVCVEVWIEKSTQEDWLLPLCRRLGANYVSGIGFQSITGAIKALKRLEEFQRQGNEKPLRIFYLSDFDPAGCYMPDGTARQLEYWIEQYVPGADIRLMPLGLTDAQVRQYKLPTIPIKESDARLKNFCERWNVEGGVELDALEALRPGTMRAIVESAIRPYRDTTLIRRLNDAEEEAVETVNDAWEKHKKAFDDRLEKLKLQAKQILEPFQARLERFAEEVADAFEASGIDDEIAQFRADVREAVEQLEIELPDRPEPEYDGDGDSDWLYDSRRDYSTQLSFYKARRHGDVEEAML